MHLKEEKFLSSIIAKPFIELPVVPNLSSPSNKECIDVLALEYDMMLDSDPYLVIHALNVKPWRDLSWHMDSPSLYSCHHAARLPLVH